MSRVDSILQQAAFRRDGFRCQECNCKQPDLTVHHAFEMAEYINRAVNDVWNMITICRGCHNRIHGAIKANYEEIRVFQGERKIRMYKRMCKQQFNCPPWRWMPMCCHTLCCMRKHWEKMDELLPGIITPPLPDKIYSKRRVHIGLPKGVQPRWKDNKNCVGYEDFVILAP